jgi:hypothetical protein
MKKMEKQKQKKNFNKNIKNKIQDIKIIDIFLYYFLNNIII